MSNPKRTCLAASLAFGMVMMFGTEVISATNTQKIQAVFAIHYDDWNIGEDYLAYASTVLHPIMYADYSILRWNNGQWEGTGERWVLDETGKTRNFVFTRGDTYRLLVRTVFSSSLTSTTKIHVQPQDTPPDEQCMDTNWQYAYEIYTADFVYPSSGTVGYRNMGGLSWVAHNAIIAGWIVRRNQSSTSFLGLPASTKFYLYPTQGATHCDPNCNTNAHGASIKITDTVDHSRRKFMVTHEFGHMVGYAAANISFRDYSRTSDIDQCFCSPMGYGDEHCLHSREYIRTAEFEGFGHFFSSLVWNDPTPTDGVFGYYKSTWDRTGPPYTYTQCVTPPCVRDLTVHDKWWHIVCPGSLDDRGTEMDWLKFLWNARAADEFTMTEILDIWDRLPDDTSEPWQWNAPYPEEDGVLDAAWQKYITEMSPHDWATYNAFNMRGISAGVDNP